MMPKETRQQVHSTNMEYKNNTYLLEVGDEVVEIYIPSPDEEASRQLKEKYGGFNPYESWKVTHQEQEHQRRENQHYKYGEPRTV